MKNNRGFTLMEMMMTVVLIGVTLFALINLTSPIIKFFKRSQPRQQANNELRGCLETITRVLANGKSSTVVIGSPLFSSISFQSMDGSSYTIFLAASPPNTMHLQKTTGGVSTDTVLATHVSGLTFGMDDKDPGIINVVLQMTVPLDSSGSPDSFLTITMPNQTIRMMGS